MWLYAHLCLPIVTVCARPPTKGVLYVKIWCWCKHQQYYEWLPDMVGCLFLYICCVNFTRFCATQVARICMYLQPPACLYPFHYNIIWALRSLGPNSILNTIFTSSLDVHCAVFHMAGFWLSINQWYLNWRLRVVDMCSRNLLHHGKFSSYLGANVVLAAVSV
jgi:hypothetical protein